MELPIYDIKQTCQEWKRDNGFLDILFEDADKNEVCKVINRIVRSDWDDNTLIIQEFNNVELSEKQKLFIEDLCKKHSLVYGRQPDGQHYLTTEIDFSGLFSDISKLLKEIK